VAIKLQADGAAVVIFKANVEINKGDTRHETESGGEGKGRIRKRI
jgi:hypothetical protein